MQKETPPQGAGATGAFRAIKESLVLAAVPLAIDGVLSGSYLLSWLYCPVWFLVILVKVAVDRPRWGPALVWMGMPFMTLGLICGNSILQNKIANANARRVVAACEAYHGANGEFPRTLDELVPRYMSSIPRAKYCLAGHFNYHNSGSPLFYWQVVPPLYRKIYNFETRRWSYLD